MDGTLPLVPPPLPDESAVDHLHRLFQVNGLGVGRLNVDMEVTSTVDRVIRELERCNVPTEALRRRTPVYNGRKTVAIGDETTFGTEWVLHAMRWCPRCFQEDLSRPLNGRHPIWNVHRRFWWSYTAVSACPVHSVLLADRCHCGADIRLQHSRMHRCRNGHSLFDVPVQEVARDHLRGEAYILARLGVGERTKVPFLDALPLQDAITTMRRLGSAKLFGATAPFGDCPLERRAEVVTVGLDIALGWPDSFERLMDDLSLAFGPGNWGLLKLYGQLYDWARSPRQLGCPEAFREVFFDSVARRGLVLDRTVVARSTERHFITFRELCSTLRMAHRQARLYLEALGYLLPGEGQKGTPVNIPIEALDRLRTMFVGRINATEVAARVGVGDINYRALLEHGLLTPDPIHAQANRTERYFLETDVDAFIAKMRGDAPVVDAIAEGLGDLPFLSRGANAGGIAGACKLIADGHLVPRAILKGEIGIRGILTTHEDIRKAERRSHGFGHSYREAAKILDMNDESVRVLIKAGILEGKLLPNNQIGVSDAAIEAFRAEYVTSKELAVRWKTKSRYVYTRLVGMGVEPVASPEKLKGYRGSLFKRSNVCR